MSDPPTILLTSFEPFGGSPVNPSQQIVEALSAELVPRLALRTTLLPVDTRRLALSTAVAAGVDHRRVQRPLYGALYLPARHPRRPGNLGHNTDLISNICRDLAGQSHQTGLFRLWGRIACRVVQF